MDPETMELEREFDEAFDNIVVVEPSAPYPDDDWMSGEFDIT